MQAKADPKPTGRFTPSTLNALNDIGRQIATLEAQRSALLHFYSAGAGLDSGTFQWDDVTGEWTFEVIPPYPRPVEPTA